MKKSSPSTKKRSSSENSLSLSEIREALEEVNRQRLVAGLSDSEIEALEMSAVALRDAERLAISKLQKSLVKEMESDTAALNALAKEIRLRVKTMSKLPKALDTTEKVLKKVLRILVAVAKW